MNTTSLVVALVVILAAGGGYYYYSSHHAPEMMMGTAQSESDAMKSAEMSEGSAGGADEKMANDAMMDRDHAMAPEAESVMAESAASAPTGPEMMIAAHGSYETYDPSKLALAEEGPVVLFFRADWCPTCRALDADIRGHLEAIPQGLTILDVNYDTFTDLKQKYGVTYQHTLVEVDAAGNMMKKWSGSPTLASLAAEVK